VPLRFACVCLSCFCVFNAAIEFFGPGNGSSSATNVVLVVLIVSLRLFHFATDRY